MTEGFLSAQIRQKLFSRLPRPSCPRPPRRRGREGAGGPARRRRWWPGAFDERSRSAMQARGSSSSRPSRSSIVRLVGPAARSRDSWLGSRGTGGHVQTTATTKTPACHVNLFPRAFSPVHGFEIRRSPRHLHIGSANQWRSHTRARHGARRLPVSKKGKKIPRRFGGWIFYNTSRPIVQLTTVQTSPRPRRTGRIKKSNRGKILSYS